MSSHTARQDDTPGRASGHRSGARPGVSTVNEEIEPEVLSYREFKKREALLAWERRRRALESQPFGRKDRSGREFMNPPRGSAPPAPLPPR